MTGTPENNPAIRILTMAGDPGGRIVVTLAEQLTCTHCHHTSNEYAIITTVAAAPPKATRGSRPYPGE